jgi:hypothetical protein
MAGYRRKVERPLVADSGGVINGDKVRPSTPVLKL